LKNVLEVSLEKAVQSCVMIGSGFLVSPRWQKVFYIEKKISQTQSANSCNKTNNQGMYTTTHA